MAEKTVLGKVGLTPKGAYNPETVYEILDIVSHMGVSLISMKAENNSPLNDSTAWMISAEKGDKGDTFTFDDLTNDQKEQLKGDVIAYNSLTDADKNDLAGRVPAIGVVEQNNTNAVSGGEVFNKQKPIADKVEVYQKYMPTPPTSDLAAGAKIVGERLGPNGEILTNISTWCRTGRLKVYPGTVSITARMSSSGFIAVYKLDGSLSRTVDPGALGIKTVNLTITSDEYFVDASFAPSGASQTAVVYQTTISENFQFAREKASAANVVERYYSNSLSSNAPTSGIELISGVFGTANAVYRLPVDVEDFQFAADLKISVDMNVEQGISNIIRVEGELSNLDLDLDRKAPQPLFSAFQTDNPTYQQQLQYNSGVRIGAVNYPMRSLHERPLVGEDVFGIWLKGNYNISELPLVTDLNARSAFLQENQDLAILFENDKISLVHDGIDVNGSVIREYSTVFELNVKDEFGVYKPLRILYEDLKTLCEIHDIDIEFYDLSYRKNAGDLLQFGKIKLVGLYGIQQDPLINTTSYNYDSFPVNFPYKIDSKKHVVEILKKGNKLYFSFDGFVKEFMVTGKVRSILIGGLETNGGAVFSNLELNRNSWGNSEKLFSSSSVSDPNLGVHIIASERTPYILGLMGHGTISTYEGSGVITNTQDQSLTRVEDLILKLRDKGYSVVSMDEFVKMYTGRVKMPKRVAFFIYDDYRIAETYENLRNRSFLSKYGAVVNFANINNYYEATEDNLKLFNSMRANGFTNITHSFSHDVVLPRKNSLVLQYQLKDTLRDCDNKNWLHNVIVYPGRGQWENTYQMLKNSGFMLAFSNIGGFSTMVTNPFDMHRLNIGDLGAYNVFNSII